MPSTARLPPQASPETQRARGRTDPGLLLLVIGFALAWIPYLDFVGDILGLIGLILVFLGRSGFSREHRTSVTIGFAIILLAGALGFVFTLWFAAAVVGIADQAGLTLAQAGSMLNSVLLVYFLGLSVASVLGCYGEVVLVRKLSDLKTSRILWIGFLVNLALTVLTLVVLVPLVQAAVSQATSGTSLNTAPITALTTTGTLLGLTKAIPSLLFAWGYYRARQAAAHWDQPRPGTVPPGAELTSAR